MTARQFSFDPDTVTVKQGQHVTLVITSADVAHGISIPGYDINEQIPAGKSVTVQFDATKTGTFTFYCSVYCGAGHRGMQGQLVVTP